MVSDHFTNLRQHRSEADAWKPRGWRDRMAGDPSLSLIPIAGAALLFYEATRHRAARNFWWLISGAAVGCAVASIGAAQWRRDLRSATETSATDIVTQESEDSFPASDAPSSNATTATTQRQTDY